MIRTALATLSLFAVCSAAAFAQAPGSDEDAVRNQRMASILQTKVISVDFKDAKLAEVMKFLATVTGINIVVDPAVFQDTPESDLTVSLQVEDLPAGDILDLICKFKKLGHAFRHGVLLITTPALSEGQVLMRVYDVRDLAVPLKDFPGPEIELKGGGETSPSFVVDDTQEPKAISAESIVEQLKSTTGAGSWDENPKCRITIFKGMLIILQTAKVHKEIAVLLESLRQTR
jgi:hypothetical protein